MAISALMAEMGVSLRTLILRALIKALFRALIIRLLMSDLILIRAPLIIATLSSRSL